MTRVSFIKFWEESVPWKKSLIFSVPWDLKFKENLITKPKKNQVPLMLMNKMYVYILDKWSQFIKKGPNNFLPDFSSPVQIGQMVSN